MLLRETVPPAPARAPDLQAAVRQVQQEQQQAAGVDVFRLIALRDRLVDALET
jgi:hypothetical protein